MKNNKSLVCDRLPAKMFKNGGDAMLIWLHVIFNKAWRQGRILDDWGKAVICPVYKSKGTKLTVAITDVATLRTNWENGSMVSDHAEVPQT